MKYLVIGSTSDIAQEFISCIAASDPSAEVITFSRSIDSHIKIDWTSGYTPIQSSQYSLIQDWDVLISFVGSQSPIGQIHLCNPHDIISGVNINFTFQFALISELLRFRNPKNTNKIVLFAGGGTNSAPIFYSTYIASKIALIKLTELIYAEYPDVHSTIVGPGWVKTKIHSATLSVTGETKTPASYRETKRRFAENDFVPMTQVISCISTILSESSPKFAGRNISVQHDSWHDENFLATASTDDSHYKLRRLS
ncbi:SDR family NAD(P)-dependent oxidoreductase [bacterium]|nr:SDR family NAD(P)-dependent oxidoreductase [bacterium]